MNWILLFSIQLYWLFRPKFFKRQCLFKETCSHHVYRITREQGIVGGIKALGKRSKLCRPGYQIVSSGASFEIQLVDGSKIFEGEAASHLLEPLYRAKMKMGEKLVEDQTIRFTLERTVEA